MSNQTPHRYLIALGSNRRKLGMAMPERVIQGCLQALAREFHLDAISPVRPSDPMGPSRRRYANAAAILTTPLDPPRLLAELKAMERQYGRRRGQRGGERVLDLDIILWSGGTYHSRHLTIPHPSFRARAFVLIPAAQIAPAWRDPVTNRTLRQLASRFLHPKPLDPEPHPF